MGTAKKTVGREAVRREYRATRPFWLGPRLLAEGDPLHLTDDEAKYRGSEIELVGVEKPAPKRGENAPEAPASEQ